MSQQQQPLPPFSINAQYVKDLSFENPNPLKSLSNQDGSQPDLDVNVDVSAQGVGQSAYEVNLKIKAAATRGKESVFIVDLDYAGVFTINDVPEDKIAPLLLIEGPRFLFPFARNVIADATREGGFPPLALAPIDFLSLYQAQQGGKVGAPSTSAKSSKAKAPASKKAAPKKKTAPKKATPKKGKKK